MINPEEYEIIGTDWYYATGRCNRGLPRDWVHWISHPKLNRDGEWTGSGLILFPEQTFEFYVSGKESEWGGYWLILPTSRNAEEIERFFELLAKYKRII
jgi:hypothetical protein